MCGIVGAFGRPVDPARLQTAVRTLAARGPDGSNTCVIAGHGAMGHTRLAILDLHQEADQPMSGAGGRLRIVFNGEIYNALELRAEIPDYPWHTDHSDTETILAAYWRWGMAFVERLRGMFAFALWDARERRLVLAVDRFSIKPLYLKRVPGALEFASTAGALAALGKALAPDMAAVHSFLADYQLDGSEHTFFEGVTQMPPATMATWQEGRFSTHRYWQPAEAQEQAVTMEEIESWIRESLHGHLLSDVPVGVNLSSGLDSNVLRLLARDGGRPPHAFTFGFPDTVYDEAARVSLVVQEDAWTVTPIAPEDLWADLLEATRATEMPLGGVAIYGHWRNARAARAAGYKVLLAGEGADEVFGGYKYYAQAYIASLWEAGREAEAEAVYGRFRRDAPEQWPCSAEVCAGDISDQSAVLQAPDGTSLSSGFLTAEFATTPKLPPPPVQGRQVRDLMWRDLRYTKVPKLLRWQDRCYMAAGIEVRVPFLDHRLIEKMARVPLRDLFAGGRTKAPLRAIAARLMPSAFFTQPKLYVATPQREWLKHDLAPQVEDLLNEDALLVRLGILDLGALKSRYRQYQAARELGNSLFVWKFVAMEAFFRAMFPGAAAASV